MRDHEAIEEHWPHLAALGRVLEALDGRTISLNAAPMAADATAMAEAVIKHINEKAQAGPVFVSGAVKS